MQPAVLPRGRTNPFPPPTNLLSDPDRGTIHKVVESGEGTHTLVFNIMEIQPFHRAAPIQALSLDTERVSPPLPLTPVLRLLCV